MSQLQKSETNQWLGYPADARLLIINADDFGLTTGVNRAIRNTIVVRVNICTHRGSAGRLNEEESFRAIFKVHLPSLAFVIDAAAGATSKASATVGVHQGQAIGMSGV